jgi:cytoskeleton protein RodZ
MAETLGEKLRSMREARGISISEVSAQTRIASRYLEAIEQNDYRTLPGGVFNKGFVKSYAKFVGVDEQEALIDYGKIVADAGESDKPHELKYNRPEVLTDEGSRSSALPTFIFAAIILGLMTWGILALVGWYNEQQKQDAKIIPPSATPNAAAANKQPDNVNAASSSNTSTNANTAAGNTNAPANSGQPVPLPADGQLKVDLKSIAPLEQKEDPQVTVWIDGKYFSETLSRDMPKTFAPAQSMKLRYSKYQSSNIQLAINGKPITIPLQPSTAKLQGIEVEITKDNLQQILQSGQISLTPLAPPGGPAANAAPSADQNAAGPPAPANAAPAANMPARR